MGTRDHPSEEPIPMLIQRVLDQATASVEDLAAEADLSAHTLWGWARERRNPRTRSLLRLADALESRGERLQELARALRRATREDRGTGD